MIYNDFQGLNISLLGFGTMRLPLVPGGTGADVDQAQLDEMIDYAIANGVNYFDTAFPYHESMSEIVIGKSLGRYPRDKFYLATKYPGHQISDHYDPAEVFEEQLKKCGVDYFDFYLLHNVNESSVNVYTDPKWGIIDYFLEQKRLGRIHHLGFSCHADIPCLTEFLDNYGDKMEFCQIQLNYLDWTLQNGKEKYRIITEHGIPVWVMEPVRGGKLAKLSDESEAKYKAMRPYNSIASWCFRFLQGLPNVKMILSGMSDMDQMVDNVRTFEKRLPLSDNEMALVFETADKFKSFIPCTGCRYCCDGCPQELDIPMLIALYNDLKVHASANISMRLDAIGPDKLASQCIGCGQCAEICPQGINVPEKMKEMDAAFSQLPTWAEMCRARDEAALKQKGANK